MGITIPDSVTLIGDSVFFGCVELKNVTIGNSVTSIGNYAFEDCGNLTSVQWNAKNCTEAGSQYNPIFKNCTQLSTVTFGDNVQTVPSYAFYGCSGLTSIVIPAGVTSIGSSAFEGCSGLESIAIPFVGNGSDKTHFGYIFGASKYDYNSEYVPASLKNVTIAGGDSIEERAFKGCSGLKSIVIPGSVTSIGYSAFDNCDGLKEVHITDVAAWCKIDFVSSSANPLYYAHRLYLNGNEVTKLTIPEEIREIKAYAFYNCSGLTGKLKIPDSVTSIGNCAFENCDGLESVTIGNSVTSIGSSAFEGCSGLKSIVISESVTEIGEYAFDDCDKLTIYCETSEKPAGWSTYWNYDNRPVEWGYQKNS